MAVGEWDQRQLCPDGGCVGVIGPDGVCKVCGRAAQNWGDERKRGLIDPPEDDEDKDDEDDQDEDADEDKDDLAADAAADEDDEDDDEDVEDDDDDVIAASSSLGDWGSRQLCPDGACIGLIGPDGKCKVCGRTASGVEPAIAPAPAAVSAADPAPAAVSAADPAPAAVSAADPVPAAQPGTSASDAGSDGAPPDAVTAADPDATKGARCADTTCSGVSGSDGRCDVCGKVVP